MAQGVLQMKKRLSADRRLTHHSVIDECPFLLDFLNRFYASRMGIRLLISQHVALHTPQPGYIGTVALHASPVQIIHTAIHDAARISERQLGHAPEVIVHGDEQATLAFLPSHLHHLMFELVKNAMRAVVERHVTASSSVCPPIHIVVSHDDAEFSVKLSDQGGGIPRADLPRIWSYLYTTITRDTDSLLDAIENAMTRDPSNIPMAGFGYGLPLARLYARFFGGDLQLLTMPNYGTDCFLYLKKFGDVELFVD